MAYLWILKQLNKSNKSFSIDIIVTKCNVHSHIMARHSCFKFHKIPFIGCLAMTQFVDFKAIQGR